MGHLNDNYLFDKTVETQRSLLKPEQARELASYVMRGYGFVSEVLPEFVKSAAEDLVLAYLNLGNVLTPDAQIELINREIPKLLRAFLEYDFLCARAEAYLVKSADVEFVKAYLVANAYILTELSQVSLIKRGNVELFAFFLERGHCCADAVNELKQSDCSALSQLYLARTDAATPFF